MSLTYYAGGATTALTVVGLCELDPKSKYGRLKLMELQICYSLVTGKPSTLVIHVLSESKSLLKAGVGWAIPRNRIAVRLGGSRYWALYRTFGRWSSMVRHR